MSDRIVRIEWGLMPGQRPREARCNARLGVHGQATRVRMARITTDSGRCGYGWSRLPPDQAGRFLGRSVHDLVRLPEPLLPEIYPIEYPLLDLAGKLDEKPVWALMVGDGTPGQPLRVRCYDTSLYIDDLHLTDDAEAAAMIAAEAAEGYARGHRDFKVKVGRGAMHMPVEQGTRRDVQVVKAVRDAIGPKGRLMLDANNGYNLNLTQRVLAETAECHIYWMEEPFHEDPRLYQALRCWMQQQEIDTLIADGEGDASSRIVDWVHEGLIDVLQFDLQYHEGWGGWMRRGPLLDAWGRRSAPHHYGEPFGNYSSCHMAPFIAGFQAVEWDEATIPGLDASRYRVADGFVTVDWAPGFGLDVDEGVYDRAVRDTGWAVSLQV